MDIYVATKAEAGRDGVKLIVVTDTWAAIQCYLNKLYPDRSAFQPSMGLLSGHGCKMSWTATCDKTEDRDDPHVDKLHLFQMPVWQLTDIPV